MALSLRKRGKIWHARGTVRVGREIIDFPEVSTGFSGREDALTWISDEEKRIAKEHIDRAARRAPRLTIAESTLRLTKSQCALA